MRDRNDWGPTRGYNVGDLVYPSYTPAKAGKIVAFDDDPAYRADFPATATRYKVAVARQPNGSTWRESVLTVGDFRWLVEGHRRKAENGEALIAKLEAMS